MSLSRMFRVSHTASFDLRCEVAKKLEDMPAISKSSAGRSTMKKTAALWREAGDVLNVFETLPARPKLKGLTASEPPKALKRRRDTQGVVAFSSLSPKP